MTKQLTTPDAAEFTIGGFTFTETGVTVSGTPNFGQYQGALAFATRALKASAWWVADLLRYADTRDDWREKLEAVMDYTDLAEQTVKNLKYIGENIAPSRRRDDVAFALHSEVAPLTPKEQSTWLDRAATEGWSRRDLRLAIRQSKRRGIIEGQADLAGKYHVIYADPPWLYANAEPSGTGAQSHYEGMTIEQLCKLPIAAHTMKNAVLFMWVTAPMLYENPGPREVIEAWGFTPKTGIVWDKVLHNFGNYVSVRHEHLLICTRGNCTPDRPSPMIDSVITDRRGNVHSEKPASFRRAIEQLYDGPYVELFARRSVPGWTCWGNQLLEEVGEDQASYANR